MIRKSWPIEFLIAAAAIVSWLGVELLPAGLVRAAVTIPLVLVLPGYSVLRLLRPELAKGLAGVCFIAGLSMAIDIAAGYLLNHAGALNAFGWATALATICITASGLSLLRRDDRAVIVLPVLSDVPVLLASLLSKPFSHTLALLVASLAMTGTALAVASRGAEVNREFKYSELWVVPDRAAGKDKFHLGIRNMEGRRARYGLEVTADGKLVSKWDAIDLSDGETWAALSSTPLGLTKRKRVEARLFRLDDPSRLYRQAWLNMPTQ